MSLSYTLRESISGFRRTKLATFLSILTIGISLLLLGIFAVATINASRFIEALRDKVEMEAFLQEPLTPEDIVRLQNEINNVEGVDRTTFVSKDDAARVFKEEFGEDITRVLEFNPLPPSFKIHLEEDYRNARQAQAVHDRVAALNGVDNVLYRKTLLEIIDERALTIHNLTLGLGVLISLSAIFLVSNTIRLAIYAKRRLLRTMELVGATAGFIRLPFLLEGIIQGLIGGAIAAVVLYVLLEYAARLLSIGFSEFIHMDPLFYLAVVATGVLLGFVGSVISVLRFIRLAGTS